MKLFLEGNRGCAAPPLPERVFPHPTWQNGARGNLRRAASQLGRKSKDAPRVGHPILVEQLHQFGQEFRHAAGTLVDVLPGHRVGDADVLSRAKGLAGHGDDMGLVEQAGG